MCEWAGTIQDVQKCDLVVLLANCRKKGLSFLALVYQLYLPSKPLQQFLSTLQALSFKYHAWQTSSGHYSARLCMFSFEKTYRFGCSTSFTGSGNMYMAHLLHPISSTQTLGKLTFKRL